MSYLDKIRCTKVDRNISRDHQKSINRIQKKLTLLMSQRGQKYKVPWDKKPCLSEDRQGLNKNDEFEQKSDLLMLSKNLT